MPARLLQSIVSLIRSWLTIDRIRTGRSLRRLSLLEPGDTLFIQDEPAVVTDRRVTHKSDASVLAIDCATDHGPAILSIRCGVGGRELQLTCERNLTVSPIPLDDVVIPLKRN